MGILAFLYVKIILLALLVDTKGKGKPMQFSAAAEGDAMHHPTTLGAPLWNCIEAYSLAFLPKIDTRVWCLNLEFSFS